MNLPEGAARTSVTVTVEEKQFVLCSLIPDKIEQNPLDHVFNEGENISFSAYGNWYACPFSTWPFFPLTPQGNPHPHSPFPVACSPVHLTGYYLPPEHDHDHPYE